MINDVDFFKKTKSSKFKNFKLQKVRHSKHS